MGAARQTVPFRPVTLKPHRIWGRAARPSPAGTLRVWVVDEEVELELAWKHGVHGLVTNRPKWAQSQVQSWYEEACAREGNRF